MRGKNKHENEPVCRSSLSSFPQVEGERSEPSELKGWPGGRMKKNSEAFAPQFFSSGKNSIAQPSGSIKQLNKRAEKQNCSCITRQFCNKVCYILELRFLCLIQ